MSHKSPTRNYRQNWNLRFTCGRLPAFEGDVYISMWNTARKSTALDEYILKMGLDIQNGSVFVILWTWQVMTKSEKSKKIIDFLQQNHWFSKQKCLINRWFSLIFQAKMSHKSIFMISSWLARLIKLRILGCFEFWAAFLIRTHRELSIPQGFSVWFGDWSAQKVSNVDGHIFIFQKNRDLEHRTAYL